jgi:hypothetical protein
MAAELAATAYETAAADAREKLRLERRRMIASLPRGRVSQDFLAQTAEQLIGAREDVEDALLLIAAIGDGPEKNRLQQAVRRAAEKMTKQQNRLLVAATDGMDTAQQLFSPDPQLGELDGEEAKALKEIRKKKEAAKKKEATESSKTAWGSRRVAPYTYKPASYGAYGGGTGGASNWALQQLITQQLSQQQAPAAAGAAAAPKQTTAAAAVGAAVAGGSQQSADYAARQVAGRLSYPCHGCGVVGHWKKDGTCNPADVAAFIKKKMAAKAEAAAGSSKQADGSDSGIDIVHSCI